MTKDNLTQYLGSCSKTIRSFIETCKSDEDVLRAIDYESVYSAYRITEEWIKETTKDILNDVIPESFYEQLTHDIERSIPTEYYTTFGPEQSKIVSFKSISEHLIHGISNLIEVYAFYKALSFAQKNFVLVGANGCGKTSLANLLQQTLNVSDGIVIRLRSSLFSHLLQIRLIILVLRAILLLIKKTYIVTKLHLMRKKWMILSIL